MRQFHLADVRKMLQIIIWLTLGVKNRRKTGVPDAQLVKQNDRVLAIHDHENACADPRRKLLEAPTN